MNKKFKFKQKVVEKYKWLSYYTLNHNFHLFNRKLSNLEYLN